MSASDHEILSMDVPFQGFARVERYRLRHRRYAGDWTPVLEREIFVRGDAAGVLPYDPRLDRILLVEQFRTAAVAAGRPPLTLEVPAGMVGKGEAPADVALRELEEEAGLKAEELIPLFSFMPSPGAASETVWLYAALVDLSSVGAHAGVAGEDEDIRIVVLDAEEAIGRLARDEVDNAITIMSLQWLAMNRERLRKR